MGKKTSISRETKVAYVKQIIEGQMTRISVAKEVGVDPSSVGYWLKQYQKDDTRALPGSGNATSIEAELKKSQRENEQLKLEVEFLKKAAAYFAKDHTKSTR